jgi:hypothetical protein
MNQIDRVQSQFPGFHGRMTPSDFTNLEVSLNPKNPKLQLLLDNSNLKMSIKDSMCKNKRSVNKLEEVLSEEMIYYYERKLRKLYDDDELHSLIISLMITLLITPNSGVLDPTYCSQHPVSKLLSQQPTACSTTCTFSISI